MKLRTWIILGIAATIAAGFYLFGFDRAKEQVPTEPKFDLSASIALDTSSDVWEVSPIWKRNTFLGDYMTGTPIQIRKTTQPTPQDITNIVRLPGGILGKWECVAFWYVKRIKPVKPPIEEQPETPAKDEKE